MMKKMFSFVLTVALLFPVMAQAQLFPPTVGNTADFASVKADLILWGGLIIAVVLAIYAFRKIKGLVK